MTDHLNNIVEAIKGTLNATDDDYVTVVITVLIGDEEDVITAETIIVDTINPDVLPCASGRISMSGWKGG